LKQCITVEQLEELKSDDKVCKLNTLMGHNWMIPREEMSDMTWNKILKDTAEYCTIGKMIEILENSTNGNQFYSFTVGKNVETYVVTFFDGEYKETHFRGKSLCDALWEAVKVTLNTKFANERRNRDESYE